MVGADVGPPVAQLLLTGPFDLLDVLERLLNRCPTRRRFQDVLYRRFRVRAEVGPPVVFLLHQHHADDTTGWPPGGQEGLDRLGHRLLVLETLDLLPTLPMPSPLGQTDALASVDAW